MSKKPASPKKTARLASLKQPMSFSKVAGADHPIYREGLTMTAVRRPPPSQPLTLEEALKLAEDAGLFDYSTSLDKGDDNVSK